MCNTLLFICAVTKDRHLELCADVTAAVLVLAISIKLEKFLLKSETKRQLISVKSPWWGGFCERLVSTVKNSLNVLGKELCNYE